MADPAGNYASEFNTRMISIAAGVSGKLEAALHAFARAAYDRISIATPIDTAQARANWFATSGAPEFEFAPLNDYKKRRGKNNPDLAAVSLAETLAHSNIDAWTGDTILYISNNAPYIGYLNEGSSPQAPSGFVEYALASAFVELRQLRIIG